MSVSEGAQPDLSGDKSRPTTGWLPTGGPILAGMTVCAVMAGVGVWAWLERDGRENIVPVLDAAGWALAAALVGAVGVFAHRARTTSRLLSESEQRFRLIADAAPAMIWTTGPDGECDYCNRAWHEFMGYKTETTLGQTWAVAVHPDDFRACYDAYAAAVRDLRDYRWEFRLRRHDGVYRWVLSFGAPRIDPNGHSVGYVGMCVDITEQQAAAQREALLRRELDHRVRNNLASLLGLIRVTDGVGSDGRAAIDRMKSAVRTMSDSHEIISRAHGEPVRMHDLLAPLLRAAGPVRGAGRFVTEGPDVRIAARRVNALGMVLQELTTNGLKHGALARPEGQVRVSWREHGPRAGRIELVWRETGCPAGTHPLEGTGLSLVRSLVASDLEGTVCFDFGADGLVCTFNFQANTNDPPEFALSGDAS